MSDKVEDIETTTPVVQEEEIISLTITNILDLTEASKAIIEEGKKNSTASRYQGSSWNSNTIKESDFRTIYFYDYSDTTKEPRLFHQVSKFKEWAEEHKVLISSTKEKELRGNTVSFCACKEGSATIVVRTTKSLLESELMKKDTDYNVPCCVGACGGYEYGRYPDYDNDYYNEWD